MKLILTLLLNFIIVNGIIFAQEGLPSFDEVPEEVKNFLDNSDQFPFGKINELAPKEIEHIGKLAGVWYCDTYVFNNDEWVKATPAFWTFKYMLDGFAVQDLWFKRLEDLPKQAQVLGHDFSGINIRAYDPYENKWTALWLTNAVNPDTTNQLVNRYDAVSTDQTFIMTRADMKGKSQVRITFHNMTENSFEWKREVSSDSGKTWNESFKIEGRRIK